MRISERSIELNFCASLSRVASRDLFWFGLTQRQEARAGFDVAARTGGRLLMFQIKASNRVLKRTGARQFKAPHAQMCALQDRAKGQRGIFYVLPNLGDTVDLKNLGRFLDRIWLLDVADLPVPLPPPTKGRSATPRRSGWHYLDLRPPIVTIHSDPFEVPVRSAADWFARGEGGVSPLASEDGWTDAEIDYVRSPFRRRAVGLLI